MKKRVDECAFVEDYDDVYYKEQDKECKSLCDFKRFHAYHAKERGIWILRHKNMEEYSIY